MKNSDTTRFNTSLKADSQKVSVLIAQEIKTLTELSAGFFETVCDQLSAQQPTALQM